MGKVEIRIHCYLAADILRKVLQECSLSSPLTCMNSVQTAVFDWLSWQPKCYICEKIFKNLLKSHKEDEAKILQKCSYH